MARRRFTTEQIIGYLRQAEVMIGRGCSVEATSSIPFICYPP